jgi:hypothetical protein
VTGNTAVVEIVAIVHGSTMVIAIIMKALFEVYNPWFALTLIW